MKSWHIDYDKNNKKTKTWLKNVAFQEKYIRAWGIEKKKTFVF